MKAYIGRQPILDRGWNVSGYELLFRSCEANYYDNIDGSATPQVIGNAVLGFGLDQLLGGKPAFIKFNRALVLRNWTTLLPPDKVVIEILEAVPADQETLAACRELKELGYALAGQVRRDDARTEALVPFIDILKVDFQRTSASDQESLIRRYSKFDIGMVAEQVETEPQFKRASQLGYHYFQGYFFASPTVLQTSHVPASQTGSLRMLRMAQETELDFEALEKAIRHDIGFSHSLLRYVNSAAFAWAGRVESVRQAMLLLGSEQMRKWVWMATVSSMSQNRPPVLVAQVLMRGRFCESIAGAGKLFTGEADPFLIGMFSLLDAILQRPLKDILDELNMGRDTREALLGVAREIHPLAIVLEIVKAYERNDYHGVDALVAGLGLTADHLNACYVDSLTWVETVFSPDQHAWRPIPGAVQAGFHRRREALAQ